MPDEGEACEISERWEAAELEERAARLMRIEFAGLIKGERDGKALDKPGVWDEPKEGARDPKDSVRDPCPDDMRELMSEDRMREGPDNEVDLIAPRLRELDLPGAHQPAFFISRAVEINVDLLAPRLLFFGGELKRLLCIREEAFAFFKMKSAEIGAELARIMKAAALALDQPAEALVDLRGARPVVELFAVGADHDEA